MPTKRTAEARDENPRRRRRRRRRNPESVPAPKVAAKPELRLVPSPEENPRRRRRRNPETTTTAPEANPRRRRRRRRRNPASNPRRKNMKGSTIALIAVGVLVGVPLVIVGGMALMGAKMIKDVKETMPTGGVVPQAVPVY